MNQMNQPINQLQQAEPVAWMHPDGRVVPAETKSASERDGGAMRRSLSGHSIPLYTHPPEQQPDIPAGWKLVPVEPTIRQMAAMGPAIRACYDMDGVSGNVVDVYRAMLAAAPKLPGEQPPTTEQSSAVQPQGEQEPRFFYDEEDALLWTPGEAQYGPEGMTALYTHPLPAQQPLSSARIDELIQEGVFGCNPYELVRRLEEERGVFKTRPLTDEQIDAMWQQSCREHFSGLQREIHLARSVEAAHGIK